jgi:uncharacterized membrane protein YdjX (TVP38/TMEM64 family)
LKLRIWDYMVITSAGCLVACVALIYLITVSGDTSYETLIWGLIFLGFGLFAYAYFYEQKYKKAHPEEFPPPSFEPKNSSPKPS